MQKDLPLASKLWIEGLSKIAPKSLKNVKSENHKGNIAKNQRVTHFRWPPNKAYFLCKNSVIHRGKNPVVIIAPPP